jgi:hypothetical protein
MNKRMKQKGEESHRFIHHFITSKIFTLSTNLQFWKSENYLIRRSKTQKNQTKYILKIHQDGRGIEEFKKDEKREKKKNP